MSARSIKKFCGNFVLFHLITQTVQMYSVREKISKVSSFLLQMCMISIRLFIIWTLPYILLQQEVCQLMNFSFMFFAKKNTNPFTLLIIHQTSPIENMYMKFVENFQVSFMFRVYGLIVPHCRFLRST